MLSDQTNTKARRFSHEEEYTGSSISSTGAGVSAKGSYGNRDSNTVPFVAKNGTQMAKEVGWDNQESGGPEPTAQEKPEETNRG